MWESYASIPNISVNVYYCKKIEYDRNWEYLKANGVNEHFLKGISFKGKFHLNLGIIPLIKRYDFWIIGGYGIPTMQLAMFLCILFNKKYVLMFDGTKKNINYYIFCSLKELNMYENKNIKIINNIKGKRWADRIKWDLWGLKKWSKKKNIKADLIISFQNTGSSY